MGIYSRSREIGVTNQTSALRAMLFLRPPSSPPAAAAL
jgi:hypothetical protein